MAFHSSSPGGFISKARWLPMVAGSPGGFPVFPCPPSAGNDSLAGSLAGPRGGSLAEAPREGPWTILLTEAGSGRLHRGSAPRKLKRKGFFKCPMSIKFLKMFKEKYIAHLHPKPRAAFTRISGAIYSQKIRARRQTQVAVP